MRYRVYCDGASRKDRRGGWGAHIITLSPRGVEAVDLFGGERDTTNNRMELMAPIEVLWYLPKNSTIEMVCDSRYVIDGASIYLESWRRAGWRTSANKPVKNDDLWRELEQALTRHLPVTWTWVRGHTGVPGNERADQLADMGIPKAE